MQIMDIVDRVVVINFGQKICEGTIEEIRENQEVVEAYFGVEDPA
jgi:ABC-type branched-subunit amino acid transport system ATPase component